MLEHAKKQKTDPEADLVQDIGLIFEKSLTRKEERLIKRYLQIYLTDILTRALEEESTTSAAEVPVVEVKSNSEDENLSQSIISFISANFGRKNRTIRHESNNGRNNTLVLRPFAKDVESFMEEAKRSNWVQEMLPNNVYVEGMCFYLLHQFETTYKKVGATFTTVPFANTMAIAGEVGLRSGQLRDLKSLLKTQGVLLSMPSNELERLNQEVGNVDENDPVCYAVDYSHEDANVESVKYSITSLEKELCLEIQKYFQTQDTIYELDYDNWGSPGILVLFGGDHGGGRFRFHAKIHLSSPQERKQWGDLSRGCPLTPMCNLECAKDTHGLLSETVAGPISRDVGMVINSSCYLLSNTAKGTEFCKAYLLPVDACKVEICRDRTSFKYSRASTPNQHTIVPIPEELAGSGATITKVVSQFHDLYIGDLAFFAVVLGMPGASSSRCLFCNITSANFNCACDADAFSVDKIMECLQTLHDRQNSGLKTKNINGVSNKMLLPISHLGKILIPTLHCPMGLIDKFLESFFRGPTEK